MWYSKNHDAGILNFSKRKRQQVLQGRGLGHERLSGHKEGSLKETLFDCIPRDSFTLRYFYVQWNMQE
jgi:hypothetical protein